MATINEIQDELISDFEMFDDWMQRYEYIIDLGKTLPSLPENKKTEENLIKGCQSRVWVDTHKEGSNVVFEADSDAIITKGLAALVVKVLSGHTPDEIVNADLYLLDKVGLKEHLSPTRANGLLSMIKRMKLEALKHKQ